MTWTTLRAAGVVLACLVLFLETPATADRSWPAWQKRRVALDQRLVRDEFRIYYTLKGEDALRAEDHADSDGDGVPDRIQDLALQLVTARTVYAEILGLRHPMKSPRYGDRVKYFDVHVWDARSLGSAGDGVVNYHRPTDPEEGVEVLTIDISTKVSAENLTPAHELFHQFQNGYTLFKNGWFTEGTARWSEYALRKGTGKAGTLPATREDVEALFKLRYDASGFWNALAQATDRTGRMKLPRALERQTYVGSPTRILGDDRLYGARFMKTLLEELDRADDRVSLENGLDPLDWKEARQGSLENNTHIWAAVRKACQRSRTRSPALRDMLGALDRESPEGPPDR